MKLDNMYQEIILDHYRHPHGKGLREGAAAEVTHINPTCGDEITLQVTPDPQEGGVLRLGQVAALDLQAGHVDGDDADGQALVQPGPGLAACLFQHPGADGDDEPAVLGHRDEDAAHRPKRDWR